MTEPDENEKITHKTPQTQKHKNKERASRWRYNKCWSFYSTKAQNDIDEI